MWIVPFYTEILIKCSHIYWIFFWFQPKSSINSFLFFSPYVVNISVVRFFHWVIQSPIATL
jgi:hypothetical protein